MTDAGTNAMPRRAGRREWLGPSVLTLACLLSDAESLGADAGQATAVPEEPRPAAAPTPVRET